MKKYLKHWIVPVLCLCFLAGCGAPAEKAPEPEAAPQAEPEETPDVQELTAIELQGFFEKAYEAKGNCLESPEQLALEVAELETLTADAALPEDYEAQYKDWRSNHISTLLMELQERYQQVLKEVPIFNGIRGGAVYADLIDLEGLGKPNLLVVNACAEEDFIVFGDIDGSIQQYPIDIGEDTEFIVGDSSYVFLIKHNGKAYIKTQQINGHDLFTVFYKVENGKVQVEDIRYDDSDFMPDSEEIEILRSENHLLSVSVRTRGILPESPPDTQRYIAIAKVLANDSVQYARLADMDGDGKEDLITVEDIYKKNEYTGASYSTPVFRAYVWDGADLQAINMNQAEDYNEIGGIYREKSTGKIYVAYYGGAGPYDWNSFERVSELIKISSEDLSWEEYETQLNRFELVEDLMWQLPKYETVEAVWQQLAAG